MTDLAHGADDIGGRFGRLGLRVLLIMILASPVAVGFLLAPKADDMPPPPELTAPPTITNLPDAMRRALPAADVQSQTTSATVSSGG
jgi:hypothetical protein